MLENLKKEVLDANKALVENNLVILTWGNVSAIDRSSGFVVIKPSGVNYNRLTADDMVVVDLNGNIVEGRYKPSSDTKTHIELYKASKKIGSVVHTHSRYATSWAQAGKEIPCMGTTHADYFYGNIPITRDMYHEEIEKDYEVNTGKVIVERFLNLDYVHTPGVLVRNHGPFTWGKDCNESVYHATVLEEIAAMATNTILINEMPDMNESLINKHFFRKHGSNAYYGQ